nr:uncharacterized protein LOC113733030 [Coffea arabica]XP_027114947.1 uncharacterized protein LOC113733030 [Coffea arabica]
MKSTMLVKPDPSSSSASSTAPTTCGNCGVEERRLLHHVRHRGIFRRLCTTCVLRLHPQSFCPTCFAVYHPSPPPSGPNDAVTCFKCYSSSHIHCVGPNYPNPYVCPNCVNPNSPIFTLKKAKDLGIEGSEAANGNNGEYRVIDKKAAKVLLAAARIAAVSMSKAAVAARAEAERRAKEAAFTRKRAREALEHVAYLVAKEKLKKKESAAAATAVEVLGVAGRSSGVKVTNVSGNNVNSNVSSVNVGVVGVGREGRRAGNVERVDGSNDVLAALNAVELREGEKNGDVKVDNVIDVVPMDVEENGTVQLTAKKSGNIDHVKDPNGVMENVSNGDAVVLPAEDQVRHAEKSLSLQQNHN